MQGDDFAGLSSGALLSTLTTAVIDSNCSGWQQESWATAKMTARCTLYMHALKIFESPWVYAHGYFCRNF